MSARKVSGERKTANEQLSLLAQIPWKKLCTTYHISFFWKMFWKKNN